MQPADEGWMRVQARVQDTVQLHNWIRSLGPDAVVEAPAALRERVREDALALAGLYAEGSL
jgi:predicted DNA-binding transcriptional regulator YafY